MIEGRMGRCAGNVRGGSIRARSGLLLETHTWIEPSTFLLSGLNPSPDRARRVTPSLALEPGQVPLNLALDNGEWPLWSLVIGRLYFPGLESASLDKGSTRLLQACARAWRGPRACCPQTWASFPVLYCLILRYSRQVDAGPTSRSGPVHTM